MDYAPFVDVCNTLSSGIQDKTIILPVKDLYVYNFITNRLIIKIVSSTNFEVTFFSTQSSILHLTLTCKPANNFCL